MDLKDLYTKVECPYNRSHMIIPLRMPYHLHKCRKNHPNVEMAVCPYNATHEVKTPELKYHMTNCPNRTLLERDMPFNSLQNAMFGKEDKVIKGNTDLPQPASIPCGPEDGLETWDEDDSPLVFRPQVSGRSGRRNPERRQVDSQLRIPQKQSIAASLKSQSSGVKEFAGQEMDNNNSININNGHTRLQESPHGASPSTSVSSSSSFSLSSSSLWKERANNDYQATTSPGRAFMAFGRGRARPFEFHPSTAFPPSNVSSSTHLKDSSNASALAFIRMGRGGGMMRPAFKS